MFAKSLVFQLNVCKIPLLSIKCHHPEIIHGKISFSKQPTNRWTPKFLLSVSHSSVQRALLLFLAWWSKVHAAVFYNLDTQHADMLLWMCKSPICDCHKDSDTNTEHLRVRSGGERADTAVVTVVGPVYYQYWSENGFGINTLEFVKEKQFRFWSSIKTIS